ncbi:MAG TPA: PP2C family serine/threonine-protein phosphatase [Terriglobales bacterium]|nr:PP2C family serine/threonine-protein phosphatase [Terriglobales bacterium]
MPGELAETAAWQAGGRSIRGAKHRRLGQPLQDAIAWRPAGDGHGIALAVADGHGSAPSFRSHIGARLAADTAAELLAEFALSHPPGLTSLPPDDAAGLAHQLTERWRERVLAHAAAEPAVAMKPPRDEAAVLVSYGSTLLAALATPAWLLYCQLGDGDILLVSDTGHVHRAWPRDERLLGVETTSLCMPEAWREVRVGLAPLTPHAPALVLLSTDGYSNSFRKDRGFLRVGRDILELVQTQGMAQVDSDLEAWLNEASDLGSGDDITVGLLYRSPLATPIEREGR